MRIDGTNLIPENTSAHEAYKQALQQGFSSLGYTPDIIAIIKAVSCKAVLGVEFFNPSGIFKLPASIEETLADVYPQPVFLRRIELSENSITGDMRLVVNPTFDPDPLSSWDEGAYFKALNQEDVSIGISPRWQINLPSGMFLIKKKLMGATKAVIIDGKPTLGEWTEEFEIQDVVSSLIATAAQVDRMSGKYVRGERVHRLPSRLML